MAISKTITQDLINVFPFGNTRATDPLARVLNEQNIAALCRRISLKPSYVIDWDNVNNIIEFMLYGYYFKANLALIKSAFSGKDIYARIELETIDGYEYLKGCDELITTVKDESSGYYILKTGTVQQRVTDSTITYVYNDTQDDPLKYVQLFNNSSFTVNTSSNLTCELKEGGKYYQITKSNTGGEGAFTITITKANSVEEAIVGMVVNSSGAFSGVSFVDEVGKEPDAKYLHILTKENKIPVNSQQFKETKLTHFTAEQSARSNKHIFTINETLPALDTNKNFWVVSAVTYFATTNELNTEKNNVTLNYNYEKLNEDGNVDVVSATLDGDMTLTDGYALVRECFKKDTINTVYFKIPKEPNETNKLKVFINSAVSIWAD